MRSQIPLPKCHGWVKQLWAPVSENMEIVAQSSIYSKGYTSSELLGDVFPLKLQEKWWVSKSQEFGGGIFCPTKIR